MAGVFDHLHVKRNSSGSPNELSFDVLEAAGYELDGKDSKTQRQSSKLPKDSQGSYHGVEGTSTLSSQPEVERRKKQRRAASRRLWLLVAVAAVAVFAVAVFVGMNYKTNVEKFEVSFESLIKDFEDADVLIAEVDALMVNPIDANEADRAKQKQALNQIPAALEKVQGVKEKAQATTNQAVSEQDAIALAQVVTAADARISMLRAARDAFNTASSASKQISDANAAWGTVLDADQKAREATALANSAVTENETIAARDMTQQALGEFTQAEATLAEIARQNPDIDFSAQDAYLDKKIEALGYAVATGDALLQGNREEAQRQNQLYNEADAQAAQLAEGLPPSIEGSIRSAVESQLNNAISSYTSARNQAIDADATIRSYAQG